MTELFCYPRDISYYPLPKTDSGSKYIRSSGNVTVTYISEMIGSRRETVSRQIKKLSDLSLIEFKDNFIFIKDIEKLRNYFYDV